MIWGTRESVSSMVLNDVWVLQQLFLYSWDLAKKYAGEMDICFVWK